MRRSALAREIIAASPRGFAAPLSHTAYFTEPLSLASGLADCTGPGSPGTFGTRGGRLRKVRSRSNLHSQRWHAPEGQGRAARIDRLMTGSLSRRLSQVSA